MGKTRTNFFATSRPEHQGNPLFCGWENIEMANEAIGIERIPAAQSLRYT